MPEAFVNPGQNPQDEYEEITSEEVDRVIAALEDLSGTVSSENVRACLEEAMNNVYTLLYDDEEAAEAA